jgi:hypothetical protein
MRQTPLDKPDRNWPKRVAINCVGPIAFHPDMIRWHADKRVREWWPRVDKVAWEPDDPLDGQRFRLQRVAAAQKGLVVRSSRFLFIFFFFFILVFLRCATTAQRAGP